MAAARLGSRGTLVLVSQYLGGFREYFLVIEKRFYNALTNLFEISKFQRRS
jgi:hypothetical protein